MPTYGEAFQSVRDFECLEPNWDSYGAAEIAWSALTFARTWLDAFRTDGVAAPSVIPTNRGGLQFEWHHNGWDVECEIGPEGYWRTYLLARHDNLIPDYEEVDDPCDREIWKIVRKPIDNPIVTMLV